jgi:hypothetical protein
MIRHVSAVAIALCLSASSVSAQTTGPQSTELTVKTASADVHKFAGIASPIIGQVQRGAVLRITRNLGSWVEVPWPGGEGGVAFLHVNAGSIAPRSLPDPNRVVATSAPSVPAPATPVTSGARAEQMTVGNQPGSRRSVYISLPSHSVGLGGRMSAFAPGFGATARVWSGNRLGLQLEVSRYVLDSVEAPGHLTSIQFAPSVLYSLPDGMTDSLWVRPYLGAGGSLYRATLSSGTSGLADAATDKGLGFQAFGGGEVTFSGVPRFALSADIGHRWSRTSFAGFEPSKIGFSLSGHWYVK